MYKLSPLLRRQRGFTLIELIIVVAIIGIIAAVVFVALDPAQRLNKSRNARRWEDAAAIVNAIKLYRVDNAGALPTDLATAAFGNSSTRIIGSAPTCTEAACPSGPLPDIAAGCGIDIDNAAGLATYLKRSPYDPTRDPATGLTDAKYFVSKDANGLITAGACIEDGEGAGGGGTPPVIEQNE